MKTKQVPAWYITINGTDIDGPFYWQAAAIMRLASLPHAKVERRMVGVDESSVIYGTGRSLRTENL